MNCSKVILRLLTVAVLICGIAPMLLGDTLNRQALVHPDPIYPTILKRYNIGGTVKLEIVVTPAGTVKSATLKGGDATLGQAAIDAVRHWKYAPAETESIISVEFRFTP